MGLGKATILSVLLFLGGCGSNAVSGAGESDVSAKPPANLQEARQLWRESGVVNYSVTAQMTCYCPQELVQPIRLIVEQGTVVSSKGLEQPLKNLTEDGAQRLTVDGLFLFIEKAVGKNVETLEVSYDRNYGYPMFINYDGHAMIADDERQYRLTDFEPLPDS
ncbi:DUF6174 domain-containing protein [Marinobacter confluentis]|uniref:Lipoprotein n=1 Tax=Marinobacter confluentis TaxID=1697557 RepID=A0A4Z1C0D4_9GAMM|nr:DUF6174 domain-containing protein [Marinobacter confluentis]TGN40438.1 hypothetical protein E5Q11_09225 [Marinobacter confluentis]